MMKRSIIIMAALLVLMLGPGVALAQPPGGPPGGGLIKMFDRNGDGKLAESEFPGPPSDFKGLDKDGDGFIVKGEEPQGPPGGGPKGGKGKRPPREDKGPKVGSTAPVFKLKSLDGKGEFDLETFKGKKPVVLFFGSYT